jgi:molecular chaperone GrpE (heat shock protein)
MSQDFPGDLSAKFLEAMDFAEEMAAKDKEHRELTRSLLLSLIEMMDSLDRFLQAAENVERPTTEQALSWRQSVRTIARQLQVNMNRSGLCSMECLGEAVNPEVHEIIGTRPAGAEPGTIIEVASSGYTWNGVLIRRPQVVVETDKRGGTL